MNRRVMPFSVASYNVLAAAHIKPSQYSAVPDEVLDPGRRRRALVHRILELEADIICLQEVDTETFHTLLATFEPRGFGAVSAPKGEGEPDGCAIFYRWPALKLESEHTLKLATDVRGRRVARHVACFTEFVVGVSRIGIVTTHLKANHSVDNLAPRGGYQQALQLLKEWRRHGHRCKGWIICGDFNATPDDPILDAMRQHGLSDAYGDAAMPYTCVGNKGAVRIDYLLHTTSLTARPRPVPGVTESTPLPSEHEPSDHLPICAEFDWT